MKILDEPYKLDDGNYLAMVDYQDHDNPHYKPSKDRIMTKDEIIEWGEKISKFSRPEWWYKKFQR